MTSWADTAQPLELAVECSGAEHRLSWRRGEVELADHPDRDAEVVLVALGGDRPRCLELAELWDEAVAHGGFLDEWVDESHLTATRLSWLDMALERLRNEGFHEFLRDLPPATAERMGRFLHDFPRPWLDRAAAAVAEAVTEGPGVSHAPADRLVPDAIAHRVRRAFVTSIGGRQLSLGAAALVPLTVGVGPGEPMIDGRLTGSDRRVEIAVGPDWLHRAWAAGASVIDGHLVLGMDHGAAALVSWDCDRPTIDNRPVAHDGTRWRLL